MPLPKLPKVLFGKKKKKPVVTEDPGEDGTRRGLELVESGRIAGDSAGAVGGAREPNLPTLHATHLHASESLGGGDRNVGESGQNTGVTGGSVAQGAAQVVGKHDAPKMYSTQPVRPPRGADVKPPFTVVGHRNPVQAEHTSLTSDYGTISNSPSVASNVSDFTERGGGQQDGLGPQKLDVRQTLSNLSLCSRESLGAEGPQFQSRDSGNSSVGTSPVPDTSVRVCQTQAAVEIAGTQNTASGPTTSLLPFSPGFTPSPPVPSPPDEIFPQSALNTPIGALRKSRKRLCLLLNIPQDAIESHLAPDYTGLAELLGFDAVEIQNFWERNPTDDLLRDWARSQEKQPFLWNLVRHLHTLGRQDILEDCCGLILEDVADHIAEQNLLQQYTVNRLQNFDCYVNIADEDLTTIGREILDTLEGVYGLRLCLTLRDVALSTYQFEEMARMLETRCRSKVLIVMSKYYEDSDACQFLTHFAVTLDPGARMNKLIPLLVDEGIFIPRVLRALAMLNYHRDRRLGFLWPRLCTAIKSD